MTFVEPVAPKPAAIRLDLYIALFKFDHLEWLLEKATELGVAHIQPLIAVRSERGLDQAAAKRIDRWRRILLEASQQSRRDYLPTIDLPLKLAALPPAPDQARSLLLDEDPAPWVTALLL